MNPILLEYCNRFAPKTPQPKPNFETFFTSLELESHFEKLPYLHDIQNFCLRTYIALLKNQNVCIYSDYDTDAITATATMYHGLINLGFQADKLEFYAPDRFTEGYGMNPEATLELAKKFDLIISVDCGINSTKEAKVIQTTDCDLIITDHHHLQDDPPDCVAVINCRLGEVYYTQELSKKPSKHLLKSSKKTTKLLKEITNLIGKDSPKLKNIKEWTSQSYREPSQYGANPELFLSQSVTGVGVAWFCLVWLGYFLEWTEK
jgi:DHH family